MVISDDMRSRLVAALSGSTATPADPRVAALARAMSGRRGKMPDARYLSLPALPPYGEPKHADSTNGAGPSDVGAFQDDAFQDDAYQVF